jgi:hypothetical protein
VDDLTVHAALLVGLMATLCPIVLVVMVLTGTRPAGSVDNLATPRSIVVMSADEPMRTSEVRDFLGLDSVAAARVQLSRWGLTAVGRDVDTGEKFWNRNQVQTAHAQRPRRGARTDLHRRTTDYITQHDTPAEPDHEAFTSYELRAPAGTYGQIARIVYASPERVHALVIDDAGQQYISVNAFNYDSARNLAREILAAGIQLIPSTNT